MSTSQTLESLGDESILDGVDSPSFVGAEESLEEDLVLPTREEFAKIMREVNHIMLSSGG